jgi:hypothetical protein
MDDTSEECTSSETNLCSDTFSSMGQLFFSFCPLSDLCSSDPFEGVSTPKNFEQSSLKTNDACTYEIKAKEDGFKSGKIIVRFNEITEVDLSLYAGESIQKANEVAIGLEAYKEYSVDIKNGSIFAIVVPKPDIETKIKL